jgi:c-di-GMP-binding flagellar brake protein YcgR
MASLVQVQLDELEFGIGGKAQIEFISPPTRYMVEILGYVPMRSLIVSCPRVNGKSIIVRDSQVVNVRLMLETAVCAFSSKIARSYLEPAPHLHIAYPAYVETSVVRQAVRVETRLICSLDPLSDESNSIFSSASGIVVDLSLGGVKLISKEDIGSVNAVMKLALNLDIAGYRQVVKLDCEIRSQEIQMLEQVQASLVDNEFLARMGVEYFFVYGVRFLNISKENAIILTAYILERQKAKAH